MIYQEKLMECTTKEERCLLAMAEFGYLAACKHRMHAAEIAQDYKRQDILTTMVHHYTPVEHWTVQLPETDQVD